MARTIPTRVRNRLLTVAKKLESSHDLRRLEIELIDGDGSPAGSITYEMGADHCLHRIGMSGNVRK